MNLPDQDYRYKIARTEVNELLFGWARRLLERFDMYKIIGWILLIAGGFIILYIRLTNIDMTETRLLIEYFFPLTGSVFSVIFGYWLIYGREE